MNFNDVHITYTKINTLYKRNEKGHTVIGDFSREEFRYLYDNLWRAFEKVDGTNMSIYFDGYETQIHGKSESAQIPKHLLSKMESLVNIISRVTIYSLDVLFPIWNHSSVSCLVLTVAS